MKKLYTLLFAILIFFNALGQVDFDPEIDVNFEDVEEIQVPASPIKSQVVFIGGFHEAIEKTELGEIVSAVTKENNDFIGITPIGDGEYLISVNQERQEPNTILGDGGGMTVFKVQRDPVTDTLIVVEQVLTDGREGKYFNVNFENTVGETWNNCGGIINNDGRIWTAEEYPPSSNAGMAHINNGDTTDVIIGAGILDREVNPVVEQNFEGEVVQRYQNIGWMVEIDPASGKALRKQYNWGRMSFEGGCILPDNKTVFLTEDGTPGLFTKFVADEEGDFTTGKLYAYNQNATGANGKWVEMNPSNLTEMINLADSAYKRGGTAFIRLEWVVELGGKVYIAETGLDNPSGLLNAIAKGGNIAQHHYDRATTNGVEISESNFTYYDRYGRVLVYDPATDELSVYLEGGPEYAESSSQAIADYPDKHLSNMDGLGKLEVNGSKYLVIQEDLNGSSYNRIPAEATSRICEMYLLDVSNPAPTIDDLVRIYVGPTGAELTGGNGTPDGKSILVDIQHPSSDVFPYTKENGVTVALTGFDQLADITDAAVDADFTNTSLPQYSSNLIHQVLFRGGTDKAIAIDANGIRKSAITKEQNDFIGITPDGMGGYYISVNQETQEPDVVLGDGGGMTVFKVSRGDDDRFIVEGQVDEESIVDPVKPVAEQLFNGEVIERYQNIGWMVEIDPSSAKAVRKQYNWGRMSFEGGAVLNDSIVMLTEDGTPGLLTKFVADKPGDYTSGKLYAYNQNAEGDHGNWVMMNNQNLDEMINLADRAYAKGATAFIRLEWVVELDGKFYIAETGLDNPGGLTQALNAGGSVAQHHFERAAGQGTYITSDSLNYYDYYGRILVYDPELDTVMVYLEGGPDYAEKTSQSIDNYPEKHLSNIDGLGKLEVNGAKYLVVQEDLNGSSYNRIPAEATSRICEMYLLDVSNPAPAIDDLVRIYVGPHGAELTGGNGTPDGKSVLVSIQHPSSDVFPYTSENGVTVALTGFDQLADITDAAIDADFVNTSVPQYSKNLIHQILFLGGTDKAVAIDPDDNAKRAVTKEQNDFIGISPDGEGGYYISVNQETQEPDEVLGDGGGMTVFRVKRGADDRFEVIANVNPGDFNDPVIPVEDPLFKGEVLQRYQNIGWMVEIDPVTAKAVKKQYNWGRMSFEGGAILNDSIVMLTEDGTPGLLTKFVADEAGDFNNGTLYAYNQNAEGDHGNWIKMDNSNIHEMIHLADYAYRSGATAFIRLEWVVELDGKFYIAETGLDNPGGLTQALNAGGSVAQHHYERAAGQGTYITPDSLNYHDYYGRILVYDPELDTVMVYLEGGPDYAEKTSQSVDNYPEKHLSNIDGLGKLEVNGAKYLVVQEDLNGSSYNRIPAEATSRICEMYLLDVSNPAPAIDDLVRIYVGPHGAELTGGNGTPDGKSVLVSIQHPSSDVFPYTSENGVTVALTGFDQLADITDAAIDVDFVNTSLPQYSENLMHQVLFVGGTDRAIALDADGNTRIAVTKEQNDFIGITPDGEGGYYISVNQETQEPDEILGDGGGMTVFRVERDADDSFVVLDNVSETDIMDTVDQSLEPLFKGEVLERYENIGWMVEIDPVTAKAIRKQYNWGRMSFEGGAMLNDSIVILTEDGTPGILTKFIAEKAGDFTKGKLFAYNQNGSGENGNWVLMNNDNLEEMVHLAERAYDKGATAFIRLEWAVELGGKFYIAETGLDNPSGLMDAINMGGNVAQHHHDRAAAQGTYIAADSLNYKDRYGRILVYDPALDSVMVYLEGGPEYSESVSQSIADYPSKHLSNVDGLGKLEVNGNMFLVIQEDLNGSSYNRNPAESTSRICEMYLLDVSNTSPAIDDLVRIYVGPTGAELTGGNGTQDGKSVLVSIQHPSSDVFPYTSQNGVTVALTGFDKLDDITAAAIDADFTNTAEPQYNDTLIHQVLYIGGTDTATTFDKSGNPVFAVTKEQNDFIGITPGVPGEFYISVNLERQQPDSLLGDGGGMTSFKVERGSDDSLFVLETSLPDGRTGLYHNVDFEGTVGETWNNCGGIISSDGRIWTAEEYPPSGNASFGHINNYDTLNFKIGYGTLKDGVLAAKYRNVDFENTVGETWNNCGGIINSDGRIWTAEEYPPSGNEAMAHINNGDLLDFMIGYGTLKEEATTGKFKNVDFEKTVGETWNNCGGIITSDGRIWTAEEYPPANNGSMDHINNGDTLDFMIGYGTVEDNARAGKFFNVDFEGTVGETWNNCGGIISPEGRIWTAEEYPPASNSAMDHINNADTADFVIGWGYLDRKFNANVLPQFDGERIERYQNIGWMVEIDPANAKAVRKQYNWGRMSFEGGCIMPDNKTVYLTEDGTPGLFTRFVADEAGDFSNGKLYVYNQEATGENGKWIEMDNTSLDEMMNLADSAYTRGATAFIRLEWIVEIGGKVYIAETGLDNPSGLKMAIEKGGNIAQHHHDRAAVQGGQISNDDAFNYYDRYGRVLVYDPETDLVTPFLEGGPDYDTRESQNFADYPARHLSNPDGLGKITVNNRDYMLICEDLNGSTYNRVPAEATSKICELYMLDMTIENPTIDDLTRIMAGPEGAELTGANGTPDGKTILVNVQHPASNTFPYTSDYGVTVALTGWDYLFSSEAEITSFAITNVTPTATGSINGTDISVIVPKGSDLTTLVPQIAISEKAQIDPVSGNAQDFSEPVIYTVTAEDGTIVEYTVTVEAVQSTDKQIISFEFTDLGATGEFTGNNIKLEVPEGTDVTSLVPAIEISADATVSPASGEAVDFTNPVTYTVTAEDGSTVEYTVTVEILVSVDNNLSGLGFQIYPNPAFRQLFLNGIYNIAIYNAEGKLVMVKENASIVNISALNPGVYYVKNDRGAVKKLIIE